eukprot:1523729-Amphidinium_carterae.1
MYHTRASEALRTLYTPVSLPAKPVFVDLHLDPHQGPIESLERWAEASCGAARAYSSLDFEHQDMLRV